MIALLPGAFATAGGSVILGGGGGGGGGGTVSATLAYAVSGDLAALTDVAFPLRPSAAFTIDEVYIEVKTAPTGASIIVDVHKNGTTIFTTQSARPEIAISGFTDTSGTPDVTSFAKDDAVTIDVDQIGSTIAGADLVVMVRGTVAVI